MLKYLELIKNLATAFAGADKELVTKIESSCQRDYAKDCLDATTISGNQARAETRLLLTDWSKEIVHSPEILLPMLKLAAKLGNNDIKHLHRAKILQLVQSELSLKARIIPRKEPEQRIDGAAVIVRCSTVSDQLIEVVATPLDQPIHGGHWYGYKEREEAATTCIIPGIHSAFNGQSGYAPHAPSYTGILAPNTLAGLDGAEAISFTLELGLRVLHNAVSNRNSAVVSGCADFTVPIDASTLIRALSLRQIAEDKTNPHFIKRTVEGTLLAQRHREIGGGKIIIAEAANLPSAIAYAAKASNAKWLKKVKK